MKRILRAFAGAILMVSVAQSGWTQVTLPSWVGPVTHNWQPSLGGVYWLDSRAVVKQAAPFFAQSSRPILVDIKSDATGFGYRFDLNTWDPQSQIYNNYPWDGTDAGTAASTEDVFNILGATSNAVFVLNIPIPTSLTSTPTSNWGYDGHGYTWQTPAFYGAMAQYYFGTADAQSVWQNLPTTLNFTTQAASFNWADLRARRGHVAPYPVKALIIGEEPYNLEGCPNGATYGPQAEAFRIAIRNRGITLPLGLHVHDMGIEDDPSGAWFWPMMNSLTASDFSFMDLEHYYQFSSVQEDFKRSFPVSVDPVGFQGWWIQQSQWKSDYTKFLWIVQDTRNAITADSAVSGLGNPGRWQMGFSEHGIQVASEFMYNDMFSAMHWANWLAESMRQNIVWDSGWTLLAEGFSTAQIQVRNGYATRTPMFFVYKMAQEFYGFNHLTNSYASATGTGATTDSTGVAVNYPWTTVRTFSDPATGNIHLFVVNQSTNQSATITGFENWNVIGWNQLTASSYSANNPLGVAGPEPIQTQSVALPATGHALSIPPISVNHIILSTSTSTGTGTPVDTTPPTVSMATPANGATVSGVITVSANASDNVAVASVQFQLDGANLGSALTSAPYSQTLDTTTLANGSHTLTATASDAAGNVATATAVTIDVTNATVVTSGTPTVSIAASVPDAVLGTTNYAAFTFTRTGSTSAALAVNYNLGGTAVKWTDYRRPVEGDMPVTITIPAGSSSYVMQIAGEANSTSANPETASIALSASSTYTVGTPASAMITIATNLVVVTPPVTTGSTGSTGSTNTSGSTGSTGSTASTGSTNTNGSTSTPITGGSTNTNPPVTVTGTNGSTTTGGGTSTPPVVSVNGLVLVTNGDGIMLPDAWPKTLVVGNNYTLTAVPAARNVFSNWIGGASQPYAVLGTSARYTFTYQSNMVLQANFVTNPFIAGAGVFNGLFSETNGVTEQTAGMLRALTVRQNGTYTGTLLINGVGHTLNGSFNLSGQATSRVVRAESLGGTLLVELALNWNDSPPQLTGTVSGTNNGTPWLASMLADRATNNMPAGEYTVLMPPDTNNAPPQSSPGGDGYALITNSATTVSITGTLADGTAFSQTTPVTADGYVPVYANLYGSRGLLLGWVNIDLTNTAGTGLTWIHPARATGLYQNGFTNVIPGGQLLISPWTNSTENLDVPTLSVLDTINDTNAVASYRVPMRANATVDAPPVTGAMNPRTGLLRVTIGTGASRLTGYAAILGDGTNGGGFYLTKTNAQAIKISP